MKTNIFLVALLFTLSTIYPICSYSKNYSRFSTDKDLSETRQDDEKPIILSYVWHNYDKLPDPTLLTHINYAFGHLDKKTFDRIDIDNPKHFREVAGLKKHHPNLKICLSIGGWGTCSEGFSQMARDPKKRKAFALECKRIIDEYGIDGIDIDWEYPTKHSEGIEATPEDTKNYTLMMKEVRRVIGKDKLLTLASSASAECFDFKDLLPIVDFVNIMSYDMCGFNQHNSALYESQHTGEYWCEKAVKMHHLAGFPLNKLVLGLPFYGYSFVDNKSTMIYYTDIEKNSQLKGFKKCWDDVAKVPYLVDQAGKLIFTFDNAKSLAYKCKYAKQIGLRGVMSWFYEADDAKGTLRKAVYKAMK